VSEASHRLYVHLKNLCDNRADFCALMIELFSEYLAEDFPSPKGRKVFLTIVNEASEAILKERNR
jgi:hypothetical protein